MSDGAISNDHWVFLTGVRIGCTDLPLGPLHLQVRAFGDPVCACLFSHLSCLQKNHPMRAPGKGNFQVVGSWAKILHLLALQLRVAPPPEAAAYK